MIASKSVRFFNLSIDMLLIYFLILPYLFDPALISLGSAEYFNNNESLLRYRGIFIIIPYYILLEYFFGLTIGKIITGTKVVTLEGNKPTFSFIVKRTFIRLIPIFDAASFLINKEGFHDSWSYTKVIHRP